MPTRVSLQAPRVRLDMKATALAPEGHRSESALLRPFKQSLGVFGEGTNELRSRDNRVDEGDGLPCIHAHGFDVSADVLGRGYPGSAWHGYLPVRTPSRPDYVDVDRLDSVDRGNEDSGAWRRRAQRTVIERVRDAGAVRSGREDRGDVLGMRGRFVPPAASTGTSTASSTSQSRSSVGVSPRQ